MSKSSRMPRPSPPSPPAPSSPAGRAAASIRRHILIGIFLAIGFGGTAAAWSLMAELSGAVVASGTVVVETNLKRVQHPTGGVVGALFVQEGDHVEAGQLVLRLDETSTKANLAIIVNEMTALRTRLARLTAERDGGQDMSIPPDIAHRARLEPEIQTLVDGERLLFTSRARTQAGLREQLTERTQQLREEIKGVEAQQRSLEAQLRVAHSEMQDVQDLYAKNLVPRTRVSQLEREIIRIEGSIGEFIARIAQSRGRISETELQIIQLDKDRATEVAKEVREVETRISELAERRTAAEDQLRRVDVRAPGAGFVHQLVVHTVGGVIGPGETVMQIVPETDALMVEARISPSDIDQLYIGQETRVRFTAFSQRTTPEFKGTIFRISADLSRDEKTGMPFYVAGIRVPEVGLHGASDLKLLPGMPAEVFATTSERTVAQVLLKPLFDHMNRSLRED